jgi:translation initiation factor 3 subunit I
MFAAVVAKSSGTPATVQIYGLEGADTVAAEPLRSIPVPGCNLTCVLWSALNASVIVAGDDGYLRELDFDDEKELRRVQLHSKAINSIAFSKDRTMIITASADMSAKLIDAKTFEVIKTFTSDRPLNGASISSIQNHVIVAGGQDALDVMHTSAKQGRFEVDFWHVVYEEKLASVAGHFGPVNALSFSPNGKMFASGSEDGFVRLHHVDATYLKTTY